MRNAGGSPDHIIRMTVYLREEQYREAINREWLKSFRMKRIGPRATP